MAAHDEWRGQDFGRRHGEAARFRLPVSEPDLGRLGFMPGAYAWRGHHRPPRFDSERAVSAACSRVIVQFVLPPPDRACQRGT